MAIAVPPAALSVPEQAEAFELSLQAQVHGTGVAPPCPRPAAGRAVGLARGRFVARECVTALQAAAGTEGTAHRCRLCDAEAGLSEIQKECWI